MVKYELSLVRSGCEEAILGVEIEKVARRADGTSLGSTDGVARKDFFGSALARWCGCQGRQGLWYDQENGERGQDESEGFW